MTGVLTNLNSQNSLKNFFADVESSGNTYYFFIGRPISWPDDSNPPNAYNSYFERESIWHDLIFGKLITNNNIVYIGNNYPWIANTIYAQYDYNDPNLFSEPFYVVTSNYSVYKCIDNNNGNNSTIQPTLTPTGSTFQTSDGYTWKYMFTIPSSTNSTFTTNNYIPIVPNTFVSNNAIPGTIDVIRVIDSGQNYQGYNEGYVQYLIDPTNMLISNTASVINNFYTGSSIYLKAGLGADQIREIVAYDGTTQVITVNSSFSTFVNLSLNNADLTGTFLIGETLSQNISYLNFLYQSNYFNKGDDIIQSDTGVTATISHANSIELVLYGVSGGNFSVGNKAYPIIDTIDSPILQTGLVSITSGSNTIVSVSANLLLLTSSQYVQIGDNNNNNVRRITSVTNSSYANVSIPFTNTLSSNTLYIVPNACEPTSSTLTSTNGVITQLNLNSIRLKYSNLSSNSLNFIVGEIVKEYNINGGNLNANGTVAFVNTSTMILSNINGTFSGGQFITGQSSNLQAQISQIVTYPNITVTGILDSLKNGIPVNAFYANGIVSGSATLLSFYYTPSSDTEYVISPTINIIGDGSNCIAYSTVNTASGSSYEIDSVTVINPGSYYTNVSISVTANGQWGNGANVYPVVSPAFGHGYDAVSELGATSAGISMTFDTASNETYKYPSYGSYRRVGIIKNPLFNDLFLNIGPIQRYDLSLTNISNGPFTNGEIVLQNSSAGIVIVSNNSFMEISNVSGTFSNNGSSVTGLSSGASANVVGLQKATFDLTSNTQTIYQINGSATGLLTQVVNSSQIRMTDVSGKFLSNSYAYDPTQNSYALVLNFSSANATINSTTTFGTKFNQTTRLTMSSNSSIPFQVGEYITQENQNASGMIMDISDEIDVILTSVSGSFSTGTIVNDTTSGGNAAITFANSTYLRLTGVQGTFSNGDNLSSFGTTATISAILSVLVVSDVSENLFQTGVNLITGEISGATAFLGIPGTIVYPDLVKNSGEVIYVNDIYPFTVNTSTKEIFNTIIQF